MVDEATREYVNDKVSAAFKDMKIWVLSAMVANLAVVGGIGGPMLVNLGALREQNAVALRIQADQTLVLKERGNWMEWVERTMLSQRAWAKSRGYVPPEGLDGPSPHQSD